MRLPALIGANPRVDSAILNAELEKIIFIEI